MKTNIIIMLITKKLLVLFAFLFLLSIGTYSQDLLILNDGTEIKGALNNVTENIATFDNADTGELMKIKGEKIEKIIQVLEDSTSIEYKMRDIKGLSSYLSGKIVSGEVSLFVVYKRLTGNGVWSFMYLFRKGEKKATKVSRNSLTTPFRKKMSKYFSDCKKLSKRIKGKIYNYEDLEKIVKYYNSNCSK